MVGGANMPKVTELCPICHKQTTPRKQTTIEDGIKHVEFYCATCNSFIRAERSASTKSKHD
jgi:hypothetical protein